MKYQLETVGTLLNNLGMDEMMNTKSTETETDRVEVKNGAMQSVVMMPQAPDPLALISQAVAAGASIETMERLFTLQERLEGRQAETAFNTAMSDVQAEMRSVGTDATNPQTKSKYASYPALDRVLRPIYTKRGFSLSFDSGDAALPDHVRILCYCGHKDGHTRTYHVDMPSDGKGAKGGDVMTKTHAMGAAFTYGQRYLLKLIFNIAVGEDNDGNDDEAEYISKAEIAELQEGIASINGNLPKFCDYMGVASLAEIETKYLGQARASVREAKKKHDQKRTETK